MGVWNCDSMGVWNCDSMGVWNCDSVGVWNCDGMGVWNCDSMGVWNMYSQVLWGDIGAAIHTHDMLYHVTQRHNFLPEVILADLSLCARFSEYSSLTARLVSCLQRNSNSVQWNLR